MVFKFTEFDIDALISLTSTTVDDFAVMLYFFSLAEMKHDAERSKQYVGILVSFVVGYTIVGFIALLSLLFGLVLTREYIALAGFVPLTAGIHKVYESLVERNFISPCSAWFSCCGDSTERNSGTGATSTAPSPRAEGIEQGIHYASLRDRAGSASDSDIESPSPPSSPGKIELGTIDERDHGNRESSQNSSSSSSSSSSSKNRGSRNRGGSQGSDCDADTAAKVRNPIGGKSGTGKGKRSRGQGHPEYSSSDSEEDQYDISGPVQASINSVERKVLGLFTWAQFWQHYRDPMNWEVLMITLASGSDHVVIYNAMMELETAGWQIMLTVLVYYIILVVHTVTAVWLIRCKFIAQLFQDYSILLIICLMIGTGVYILKDSVLFVLPGTAAAESLDQE